MIKKRVRSLSTIFSREVGLVGALSKGILKVSVKEKKKLSRPRKFFGKGVVKSRVGYGIGFFFYFWLDRKIPEF